MPGEGEVPEVVGSKLQFEALLGLGERRHHDTGVVDQQVEALMRRGETLREGGNRIEIRQVEQLQRRFPRRLLGKSVIPGERDYRSSGDENAYVVPAKAGTQRNRT